MNPLYKQTIHTFLTTNKLNPQERPPQDGAENWVFDIAENLQSELFCYETQPNDISAILMTSVQIKPNDNATMLAAAICPALAPAAIVIIDNVLSLRLMVRGDVQSIGALLEESIMITHHIISSIFPHIVNLADGKTPMQNAMILAMQALQGGAQGKQPDQVDDQVDKPPTDS